MNNIFALRNPLGKILKSVIYFNTDKKFQWNIHVRKRTRTVITVREIQFVLATFVLAVQCVQPVALAQKL